MNIFQAKSGGLKVGIIGIGGLGQMGVRLAKAMGKKYVINLREGCILWGGILHENIYSVYILIFSKKSKV